MQETLRKESRIQGTVVPLPNFTKRVRTTVMETGSSAEIRAGVRRETAVIAAITGEGLRFESVSAIETLKSRLAKSHAKTLRKRARTHALTHCLPSMAMVEQNVGEG